MQLQLYSLVKEAQRVLRVIPSISLPSQQQAKKPIIYNSNVLSILSGPSLKQPGSRAGRPLEVTAAHRAGSGSETPDLSLLESAVPFNWYESLESVHLNDSFEWSVQYFGSTPTTDSECTTQKSCANERIFFLTKWLSTVWSVKWSVHRTKSPANDYSLSIPIHIFRVGLPWQHFSFQLFWCLKGTFDIPDGQIWF